MSVTSTAGEDRLMKVSEALKKLNVSRSWLYEALLKGNVTGIRYGRTWRIRESVVHGLASTGTQPQTQ